MAIGQVEEITTVTYREGGDGYSPWPVSWSAVWVGTLSAVALAVIFGLVGVAIGAHRIVHTPGAWREMGFGTLFWSVFGAFLAFVAGGWVACKIAGFRRSETAMLHGAIVWLVALPLLLVFTSLGAATYLGSWYGGLAGTPVWIVPAPVTDPVAAALAARHAAVTAVTALLLGLAGSVIGGWMASGEPMTFTHYRTRAAAARAGTGGW